MYTYPHTIENGAGERLIFLRKSRGQHGDRLEGGKCTAYIEPADNVEYLLTGSSLRRSGVEVPVLIASRQRS